MVAERVGPPGQPQVLVYVTLAGHRPSAVVVVSLAGAFLAAPGIAGAAVAQDRPAAKHPAASHPAPEQIALAKARATGRAVEIVSDRTATSTVYAEPSGMLRAIITAVPTRVGRGARWIPASTVLRRAAGGAIRPAAISQPMVLSGGGTARPLVRLGSGAKRLDMRWPGRLPAPLGFHDPGESPALFAVSSPWPR